ncbi:hypothetical protein [Nevskia sp.]|nr:hypothetical protein [Nevskia sp.]
MPTMIGRAVHGGKESTKSRAKERWIVTSLTANGPLPEMQS